MIWLAVLILLAVAAVCGFLALRKARDAYAERKIRAAIAEAKARMAQDGIDEDSPVVQDIAQAARDEGRV